MRSTTNKSLENKNTSAQSTTLSLESRFTLLLPPSADVVEPAVEALAAVFLTAVLPEDAFLVVPDEGAAWGLLVLVVSPVDAGGPLFPPRLGAALISHFSANSLT